MRFAGIKELKHKTMELLKESQETDVIITAYGKPTAILHHITEDELADVRDDRKVADLHEDARSAVGGPVGSAGADCGEDADEQREDDRNGHGHPPRRAVVLGVQKIDLDVLRHDASMLAGLSHFG